MRLGSRRQVSTRTDPPPPPGPLDFTSRISAYVPGIASFPARAQVSADYSPGSCESDSVVVVTASRQRAFVRAGRIVRYAP